MTYRKADLEAVKATCKNQGLPKNELQEKILKKKFTKL